MVNMNEKILAKNRKVFHDYEVMEKFEAGIELLGCEVKSILANKSSLNEGYAQCDNGETFLFIHISHYGQNSQDYDPVRKRKLLLKKKEIIYLSNEINRKKLTLIPLQLYLKNRKIKVEIALCRGLKKYDKREKIVKEETKRQLRNLK